MSDAEFSISLTPATQRLLDALPALPAKIQSAMLRVMDEQNELTIGYIRQHFLSQRGPTTLGVVTNRLRSSINASKARLDNGVIRSAIGSNVKYAAFHEFGFDCVEQVRQYVRRLFKYGPRPTLARVSKKTGKLIEPKRKRTEIGQCIVHAHKRRVIYGGRSFLLRGVAARQREYAQAIGSGIANSFRALSAS
jgi:hypothetical protein